MSELCTLCYKSYKVVVNFIIWDFGIGSSDNLVEKGRDMKWWFIWVANLVLCLLSYSQGMFEYLEKSRFPSNSA